MSKKNLVPGGTRNIGQKLRICGLPSYASPDGVPVEVSKGSAETNGTSPLTPNSSPRARPEPSEVQCGHTHTHTPGSAGPGLHTQTQTVIAHTHTHTHTHTHRCVHTHLHAHTHTPGPNDSGPLTTTTPAGSPKGQTGSRTKSTSDTQYLSTYESGDTWAALGVSSRGQEA